MKTTFIHGIGIAIAGAILTFALYFLGFHDSVEKLGTAQTIGMVGGFAISIGGLTLAIRARRDETPADEPFGYGRALGAGTLTTLWSAIFGTLFHVLYTAVINPGMQDIIVENELNKLEAQGMTAAQIESAEGMIQMMTGPVIQSVFALIFGFLFGFIISLVVSIFLRREAVDSIPPPPVEV